MYHEDLAQVSADKAGKTGWNQPLSWFRLLLKLSQAPLSYCMTLCLWVKTSIPVSVCPTSAFVLFLFRYMYLQNHLPNENRCLRWWSIHNTTLFLLHFSTLSWIAVFVHMQVKDTFTWEVTSQEWLQCKQQRSQLKKLRSRAVSRISLIKQQSNPTATTCQFYQGNTSDSHTADQKSHSSGITYLNTGHQTMQACPYCIK